MTVLSDDDFLESLSGGVPEIEESQEELEEDLSEVEEDNTDEVEEEIESDEEDTLEEEKSEEEESESDDDFISRSITPVKEEKEVEVPEEDISDKEESKSDINYEEFYGQIMKPFKANGKMFEPKTSEEAVQLMQMGANYTKNMQELSRHKKAILMLDKNGLLDEDKISFLIDLDKRDPEAVKKFLVDAKIDPLDIDIDSDVDYDPSSNKMSDIEVNARTTLEELRSTPEGSATIKHISDSWDDASIDFLWNNPQAFNIIHEQRESGIYDQISNEIERLTTLGMLPQGIGFLEAYNQVGNHLFGDTQTSDNSNKATKKPIKTRVHKPTSSSNSDRAKAASPSRTAKRSSSVINDLVDLDDSEFLKQMQGRL